MTGRRLFVRALVVLGAVLVVLGGAQAQKTLNVSLDQDPYIIDPTANWLYDVPANMFKALTLPDFSGLAQPKAWKWVIMFALIGSLESLLSAKAEGALAKARQLERSSSSSNARPRAERPR